MVDSYNSRRSRHWRGRVRGTAAEGRVWVFAAVDHYTAEAWTNGAKVGYRFAALEPMQDEVVNRFGVLEPDISRGIELRHEWGSQYRSLARR